MRIIMKMKITLMLVAMLSTLNINAFTVETAAGKFGQTIGADTTATSIIVIGELNAADFAFIAQSMSELSTLDLSGAKIVAYTGKAVITEQQAYEADVLPDYALMGSNISTLILPNSLKKIGDGALAATQITSIEIPASVTTIGMGAFSNCDELTAISIPATVTTIGSHAFMGCDQLATVAIAGATEINDATFARCPQLTNVTLPASTTSIGNSAFNGCGNVVTFSFGNKLEFIGSEAFQSTGLAEVDLSACNALDSIGDWAFAHCAALVNVKLPDGLSAIGHGAFFEDSQLSTLTIPSSCTALSDYMLKGTIALDSTAIINSSVEHIGNYSMMGWEQISVFTLPPTVIYIGDNAFEGWTSLERLNAEDLTEVPALGSNVWQGLNQENIKLVVSNNMFNAFEAAEQWTEFDITNSTAIEEIITDDPDSAVTAHFEGFALHLNATNEIAEVKLYDSSGRQYIYETPQSTQFTINTDDWNCRIYILKVRLTDGTSSTLKLARRQ